MIIDSLFKEGNITLTVGLNDLKEFAKDIIEQTKRELEDLVIAKQSEMYVSRQRACEILDVDATTMWRWAKRSYLIPVAVCGKPPENKRLFSFCCLPIKTAYKQF